MLKNSSEGTFILCGLDLPEGIGGIKARNKGKY